MATNENGLQKAEPRPLPNIDELYNDIELAGNYNKLNRLLNHAPKAEWLRDHPTATRKVKQPGGQDLYLPIKYMPIGRIEHIATAIFLKTRTEVKAVQLIANTVVITVRVWVLDPITGKWDWQEGVGGAPIRTNKGAAATDFAQIQDSAVQTAAPAAKSYAEKDAFEKFGKIFGRDLNRADEISYQNLDRKLEGPKEIPEELIAVIDEAEQEALDGIYNNNKDYHSNPKFLQLLTARKDKLKKPRRAQTK